MCIFWIEYRTHLADTNTYLVEHHVGDLAQPLALLAHLLLEFQYQCGVGLQLFRLEHVPHDDGPGQFFGLARRQLFLPVQVSILRGEFE